MPLIDQGRLHKIFSFLSITSFNLSETSCVTCQVSNQIYIYVEFLLFLRMNRVGHVPTFQELY